MRLINIIYFLLPMLVHNVEQGKNSLERNLFVCYGKINPDTVKGYGLVILESQHYNANEIAIFNKNNDKVIAYISLTEVNKSAFFYSDMEPYTIGDNTIWESRLINIKTSEAQEILFDAIEKIKAKGFSGFFLDNLDNVSQWGELSDQKLDMVQFIKEIKKRNDSLFLVQNSGLFISEELKNSTDAILLESVVSKYNFEEKRYAYRDIVTKTNILKEIKKAGKQIKKPIYILEYANNDTMKTQVVKELKSIGHPYFIAQIDLQRIPQFTNN